MGEFLDHPNKLQYDQSGGGHYESYFLRANHPEEARAIWIRYTIFQPAGSNEAALGEVWAMYFDGRVHKVHAGKQEVPLGEAAYGPGLQASVGSCSLQPGKFSGQVGQKGEPIQWDLHFQVVDGEPVLMFPEPWYSRGFPKAKSLVPAPRALFSGTMTVAGETIQIENWIGSQNHNWGVKHTDQYAWGQVVGFKEQPDWFLEVATARVKLGPLYTPWFVPVVLRTPQGDYPLHTMRESVKAHGQYKPFDWTFRSQNENLSMQGRIWADRRDVVALTYYNPPGGYKHCLNTKVANCDLSVQFHTGPLAGQQAELHAPGRAAFEILTDDFSHGVDVRV